jgi:hypothetical protein
MSNQTFTKALVNPNYKILRVGQFVEANEESGEFLYEEGNYTNLTVAVLKEIASANKFSISSKLNKDDFSLALDEAINNSNFPQVNKMTDSKIAEEKIKEGMEAGLDDDTILISIVQAGVKFQNAGKLFKQYMQKNGLRVSPKERNAHIEEILEEAEFNPESIQEIHDMRAKLAKEVPDTSEKQALQAIRRFCKKNEIELPKIAKRVGGMRAKFLDWLANNSTATQDDLSSWLNEQDIEEERAEKLTKQYTPLIALANTIRKNVQEELA